MTKTNNLSHEIRNAVGSMEGIFKQMRKLEKELCKQLDRIAEAIEEYDGEDTRNQS